MKKILTLIFAALIFFACEKPEPEVPFIKPAPGTENELTAPGQAKTMVVAHRGGSAEAGKRDYPDNSLAALRYAMSLGCYASECDIFWTKDNQIIVAHDSNGQINGMYPWQHTLAEIQAAGRLTNGETIPSLQDYIKEVMKEGSCTKLWLDIKNITKPKQMTDEVVKACERSCEIIKEMKADNFVEFICTGNQTVFPRAQTAAKTAGIPFGWMNASFKGQEYRSKSCYWANLSIEFFPEVGNGSVTIDDYVGAGVEISVYNADTDAQMNYFVNRRDKMKAICTNYPKKLIAKMK